MIMAQMFCDKPDVIKNELRNVLAAKGKCRLN